MRKRLKSTAVAAVALPVPAIAETTAVIKREPGKPRRLAGVILNGVPVSLTDKVQEAFNSLLDAFDVVSGVKPQSRLMERIILQLCSLLAWDSDPSAPSQDTNEKMRLMTDYLSEIQPKGGVQTMLAVQMIGVHEAATKSLVFAKTARDVAVQEGNILRATRLMRLFNEQLEAMAKLKGTSGQQKVIVEHVNVHHGGQAVVGMVAAQGTLPGGPGDE